MSRFFVIVLLVMISLSACTRKTSNNELISPKNIPAPQEAIRSAPEVDEQRTEWQNPELVISKLGDLTGKTVVDVGAGSGYFSFKLASLAEKVVALEVDPKALEYIEEQKQILGDWTDNIEARLTPPDVPNLLPEEADKVLIVNTYTFLPDKVKYLVRLRDGMKDGAEIIIIDFKKGDIPIGPSDTFKQDPSDVVAALRAINLGEIKVDLEMLEFQYIITAKK